MYILKYIIKLNNQSNCDFLAEIYLNLLLAPIPGQIQNQRYGVCINSKVGYCQLTYSAASYDEQTKEFVQRDLSFSVSGDSTKKSDILGQYSKLFFHQTTYTDINILCK